MKHTSEYRKAISLAASALALGVAASWSTTAPAAEAAGASSLDAATADAVDTLIVTGSRARGRTVENSPAPIDVLSATDIRAANQTNLLDVLNTLTPSFNLPSVATPDIGSMVRAGQLRGLSPDQTLVLVNGKRRHGVAFLGAGGFGGSAPADLSLIPTAAIDRIEILRDGASAIYGSDAIAGVINIITKRADHGGEVSFSSGRYYDNDGPSQQARFNVGAKLGQTGYVNVSGEVVDQDGAVRNFAVPSSYLYYFPTNAAGQPVSPGPGASLPPGATPDPREAGRDRVAWKNIGVQPFTTQSLALDAGAPINDKVEAYVFATYSHRRADAPQNFRTPTRDTNVRAIYPDGFAPVEQIRENDFALTGGLKGQDLLGWDWDFSSSYGRDQVDAYARNSLNPTLGAASPTSFYDGRLDYSAWTTNLDLRRAFQTSIPLDASAGAEYRRETYAIEPGEVASYVDGGSPILDSPNKGKPLIGAGGAQGLPGFRPEDEVHASREGFSAYAGLAAHVTPAWLIDVAARYENYSDFGDTVTGRLTTRYDVNPRLAFRATISNGFHAPPLAAEFYKNTANINTYQQHTVQVNSRQAAALGAVPLKPEKSVNYSLGFVAQPLPGVHLAVDAYQIEVTDRIALSTTIRDAIYPGAGALVQAAGFAPDDGVNYFVNAADTRTRGVDVTLDGAQDLGVWGRLLWSAALNFNKTEITRIADTPSVLKAFNIPVFSVPNQYAVTYLAPRDKEVFSLTWLRGPWRATLRQTHFGEVKRPGTPATVAVSGPYAGLTSIDNRVEAAWVTDLGVSYSVSERLKLALDVNNLFNARPSKTPQPLLSPYQTAAYNSFGPLGVGGGFWSARISYAF